MKSHTVPRKLLEQFAYFDPHTKSLRLWRYEKGRAPYANASPKSATRIESHFQNPDDPSSEQKLESRLAAEIEDPVNEFLFKVANSSFVATDEQRRRLTRYVILLFYRSEARRNATKHLHRITTNAVQSFISNERQVLTVAAKWSIDLLLAGRIHGTLVRPTTVIDVAKSLLKNYDTEESRQRSYAEGVERALSAFDERLYEGTWRIIESSSASPYIIGDAPVATWERQIQPELFSYGLGFHRPNVEVILPVSPLMCLHILPNVERTRPARDPTPLEVNIAQAAFSGRFCYANILSDTVNQIMQQHFSRAQLGVNSFTIWHRSYDNSVYELLMNDGRWVEPPLR
jgi:Protein of unknown function (DUF4238)